MTAAIGLADPAELTDALIEREGALATFEQAADRATVEKGSAVVVAGRSGEGKSSLIGSLRSLAEREGMDIVSARGRELEQDFPFGVVLQLFESRLARAGTDERRHLLSGPAREAMPIFAAAPRPAERSFAVLHGLYWLLRKLAERAPLIVAVDDADLADRESLRFLVYLIERIEDLGVVVVLAYGSALRPTDADLLGRVERHPSVVRCVLEPLSSDGTKRYIRGLLPNASDELCRAAHESTRGNPWLLRAIVSDGSPEEAEAKANGRSLAQAAPRPVADHVRHRAASIDRDAPALLEAVAVLGDDAEIRHAAALARIDQPDVARLADELIGAGLLVDHDRLRFVEPVVRRAVEAALPPAGRAELHLNAARMLSDEDGHLERVASHLLSARRSGIAWTVDVLVEAAARASANGQPATAVNYLRRALVEPPVADRRPQVVLELGRAEARAGDPEAVAHLTEAIERIPDRRQRAQTALDAGRTLFVLGRHRDARLAFERGIRELDDRHDGLSGRLSAALGTVAHLAPTRKQAASAASVETRAPGAETPADRAQLALLALEAAFRGDPRERVVELAVRALSRGLLLDEETADGIAYYLACHALVTAEDLATAEAALTAAVEEARTRGSVLGLATASFCRSLAILRRGRMRDAAADAREAVAGERHGWRLAIPAVHSVLAETLVERGDIEAARRELDAVERAAEAELPMRAIFLSCKGQVAYVAGEPQQALAHYLECGRLLEGIGAQNPAVALWRSGAGRALAAVGDRAEGLRLVHEELSLAERFRAPGPIGRALGVLGAIEENGRRLEALEAAVERLEASQAALERARALVDFGAALRRAGQRRAARGPLLRGLDLAGRCGADALAGRAVAETRLAGARPRRTALQGRDSLTPRERQVAELAVEGLSNREIAKALFVTVKTVEWHLKHAFRKLGVRTRRELIPALADPSD